MIPRSCYYRHRITFVRIALQSANRICFQPLPLECFLFWMALLKCRVVRGYEAGMSNTDCLLLWIRSNVIKAEVNYSMDIDTLLFEPVHPRIRLNKRRVVQTVTTNMVLKIIEASICKETGLFREASITNIAHWSYRRWISERLATFTAGESWRWSLILYEERWETKHSI